MKEISRGTAKVIIQLKSSKEAKKFVEISLLILR